MGPRDGTLPKKFPRETKKAPGDKLKAIDLEGMIIRGPGEVVEKGGLSMGKGKGIRGRNHYTIRKTRRDLLIIKSSMGLEYRMPKLPMAIGMMP